MLRGSKVFVVVLCTVFAFQLSGVFAQTTTSAVCSSTTICGSAPKEFTMLMDMSRELLTAIKTLGTQGEYLGKPVNPNRFEGTTFNPPKQTIVGKVGTKVKQALSFTTATLAIFTSPKQGGGLLDIFGGIMILFKNKVFARDMQTVQEVDAMLTQKRYELGVGGGRYSTVSSKNIKIFQTILASYKTKGLLKDTPTISSNVKYYNIVALVGRVLAATKGFLASSSLDDFTQREVNGTPGISLSFDTTTFQNMADQYDCVRGSKNICDSGLKNFVKGMKKIGSGSVEEVKRSINTFSAAGKRLAELFSKNPSKATADRKEQLLKSYYGSTKVRSGSSFKDVVSITVDDGGALSSWRSATLDDESKSTSSIDKISTATTVPSTTSTTFAGLMKEGVTPIFANQKRDLELVNFAEVKDFTFYFDTLGRQIATILGLLGNKDTNTTLIKELGESCDLQCGGIEKTCW